MVSTRPDILVDSTGTAAASVGVPAPLGRRRVVQALPSGGGPRLLAPAELVCGPGAWYIGDVSGAVLGTPARRVARMVSAGAVPDTRRL
jgi:hypothetical protein